MSVASGILDWVEYWKWVVSSVELLGWISFVRIIFSIMVAFISIDMHELSIAHYTPCGH